MENSEKCRSCKTRPQEPCAHITHSYKGLTFFIFKNGFTCTFCAIHESQKLYDELAPRFLELTPRSRGRYGKSVHVHWNRYVEAHRHLSDFNREADRLLRLLEQIGVLSWEPKNSWDIVTGNLSLAPSLHVAHLYFTRREDAEAYARANLGNTQYSWELRLIADVVSKHEVLTTKTS